MDVKLLPDTQKIIEKFIQTRVGEAGADGVVIGLSGGIDSTLVACIAVDALGADHVHGISMPSKYSSDHSLSDAKKLAENLFGSLLGDSITWALANNQHIPTVGREIAKSMSSQNTDAKFWHLINMPSAKNIFTA